MGIVNISPDSFSDGGLYTTVEKAIEQCLTLVEQGADIIDIGGESTRPGSEPVSMTEELKRVLPVIKELRDMLPNVIISVDTYKSEVARKSIESGANLINDISSMQFDNKMDDIIASNQNVSVVLMHIKGTPKDMQINPTYDDPVLEIIEFFEKRIDYCLKKGISTNRIIIDPGIGFGKKYHHNIEIIKRLQEFHKLGCTVMLGASRKSFMNSIFPATAQNRIGGTLATTCFALLNNIHIVRVHDVKENKQFIDTYYSINDYIKN